MILKFLTLSLATLLALSIAASAQETERTNSMTLPDGTKVQILQEYAASYMVTKAGEHKPFFVEKIAIINPNKHENNHMHWANLDKNTLDSMCFLSGEENGKYVQAMMASSGNGEYQKATQKMAGLYGQDKVRIAQEATYEAIAKTDPSLKDIVKKMRDYKPWEDTNNPISVLTPEEGKKFFSVATTAEGSKATQKALEKVMSGGYSMDKTTDSERVILSKAYFKIFEAEILKQDPTVEPLLKRVKNF